jgi:hypothetical protein
VSNGTFVICSHAEVDEPSRTEVAEYFAILHEASIPFIAPEIVCACFASVYESLGIFNPLFDVRIDVDLAVFNPLGSNVVGVNTECVVCGACDCVSSILQLSCCFVELIPVGEKRSDFCRIICSEYFSSDVTSVNEDTRASLPGNTAENAVSSNNILWCALFRAPCPYREKNYTF